MARQSADEHDHHVAETRPLLAGTRESTGFEDRKAASKTRFPALSTLVIMIAAVVVLEVSDGLIDSPMTRLIESVSCFRYYERVDPSRLLTSAEDAGPGAIYGTAEAWCKVDDVQGEVAMIRSWQFFFDGIPALALAVPFAWLQDRFGRRPFVILGVIALVLRGAWIMFVLWYWRIFRLEWTWASSLHALMMGGGPVVSALFFTMMTDITAEAQRATAFMRLGACTLLMGFMTPPLTAYLMTYNPWVPVFVGAGVSVVGIALVVMIPETLVRSDGGKDQPPVTNGEAIAGPFEMAPTLEPVSSSFAQRMFQDFGRAMSFLWADLRIPALLLPFALHSISLASVQLLVQYASKRYYLSISEATLLITIRAGVTFLMLFALIPALSTLMMSKLGISSIIKDLLVTRTSLAITALGWALIGLAPTAGLFASSLVVTTLGSGAMYSLRSILTALVPPQQIALAYSITSIIDTLGLMLGTPLLAQCFETGMAIGDAGIGLPFYILAVACFSSTLIMLMVRIRSNDGADDDDDDVTIPTDSQS